jgi:tetratricopeptide (TPR) repeat protein
MSVSIPTAPLAGLKAKLSSIDLPLLASIGSICGTFAVISYLQVPQLAKLKQPTQYLNKADLQRQEAKAKAQFSLIKNLPTFGFDNLIADWHFLAYLQYFGESDVRQQAGYGAAMDYFDIILDRDPRFFYAYYYLSNTGTLYTGQPERSVALMNKGLKSLSPRVPDRSYYIWRLKAVDELLFLGKASEARNSMQMASNWARQYPNEEGQRVAKLSQDTANSLARNPNSKRAQFDAWNMVLSSAIDDAVTKRAIAEIVALGGKVTVSPTGAFTVQPPAKD